MTRELRVGTSVELGIRRRDGLHWYRSRVEDIAETAPRTIVGWPLDHLQVVPVDIGQVVHVQTSGEDALYAIDMQVDALIPDEPPRIGLVGGTRWERVQRRDDVRHGVVIRPRSITRYTIDGWQPIHAAIRNISAGGVLVWSDEEVRVGEVLELAFSLPGDEHELQVRATVRRAQPGYRAERDFWEIGCGFQRIARDESERIIRFIFAEQRKLARRQAGL